MLQHFQRVIITFKYNMYNREFKIEYVQYKVLNII